MSSNMRQRLATLPKPSVESTLAQDQSLYISCQKYYAPDRTIVALYISNKCTFPIQNVEIQLFNAVGISATFDGEPVPRVQTAKNNGNILHLQSINAGTTSTQLVGLQCAMNLSLFNASSFSFNGTASFSGGKRVSFVFELTLRDLLRPLPIKTKQVGEMWKQYNAEVKFQVKSSSCRSSPDFMKCMTDKVGIFPVQTINQENIAAGKLVGTNIQNPVLFCLVHGNVQPNGISVISKTTNKLYSQHLASLLKNSLNS